MEIKFLFTRGTSHSASNAWGSLQWQGMLDEKRRWIKLSCREGQKSLKCHLRAASSAAPDPACPLRRDEQDALIGHHRGASLCQQLPLYQISAVSEKEQGRGIKEKLRNHSQLCIWGRKFLLDFWGVRVNYSHHTASAQSVQRTVLIVFPMTCKAEKCLTNSDCSAKRSIADKHLGWLHECSRIKH